MTVYIEYVIIDNMVITALITYFTVKAMRLRMRALRILLVSVLGTAIAVLLPLITVPGFVTVVIKIATGFLLSAFIGSYKSLLQYLKTTVIFFAVTFGAGGVCFGLLYILEGDIGIAIKMGYEKIPVGIIVAGMAAAAVLIKSVINRLRKNRYKEPFYYDVKLYLNGGNVVFKGYLDSGNNLYDKGGNPVVVVNNGVLGPLIADNLINNKKTKMEKIEFKTVNGVSTMKVFKPDKIEVYSDKSVNILYDVTVGITDRVFEDYSCLLHPACVA